MKELTTTIDISSSHKEVWNKITDLSNWHIWNPIIYQLDGKFEPNSKLDFIMSNSKGEKGKNILLKYLILLLIVVSRIQRL